MSLKVLLTSVILVVAVGIPFYAYYSDFQSHSSETPAPATVEVLRSSLQTRVSETGTIQPSKTLEIKSQFSGEVVQLFVLSGKFGRKGELLSMPLMT